MGRMAEPNHALTYTISEKHYLDAQRLHARFKRWYVKLFFAVLCIAGVVLFGTGLYHHNYWLALAGLVYMVLPWSVFYLITLPLARRSYRNYPAMHQPQTLEVEDEQLVLRSAIGDSKLPWKYVVRWAEDVRFILVYIQPNMFFIVPKAADAEGTTVAKLQNLLRTRVGPARRL